MYSNVIPLPLGVAIDMTIVRTKTDIKLWSSRYHDPYAKTTGKNKN